MELSEVRALPIEDRVTLLVGRIARESVALEVALRATAAAFAGPQASPLHGERAFSDEIKACRRFVTKQHEELRQPGLDTLKNAQDVYNLRSRYVHDLLVAEEGGQLERVRLLNDRAVFTPDTTEISPDDLENAVLELIHATWRVRAIGLCIGRTSKNYTHWFWILRGKGTVGWDRSLSWER